MPKHITNLCRFLRISFSVAIIFPLVLSLISWIVADFSGTETLRDQLSFQGFDFSHSLAIANNLPIKGEITAFLRVLGFLATLSTMLLSMFIFWSLRGLFGLFEKGEIFTQNTIKSFRSIGFAYLGITIAQPIEGALLSLILTSNNPVGEKVLAVSLGSPQLYDFVTALVFIVIAWVMQEGQKLDEEKQLTV